jgi:hypothetical protein
MKPVKFALNVKLDDASGQILLLRDPKLGVDVLRCEPGAELELNGRPLVTRLCDVAESVGEHISVLEAGFSSAYGAGVSFRIRRVLTLGGDALQTGPSNSVHIRYEVRRVPRTTPGEGLDYIWQPELEAPLQVETLGVMCAPVTWFGPTTRMRAIAIGGSGPREHVSLEDGPVAEVVPYLQTAFRTTFPGQQTIPGALYYRPGDEAFVWSVARRATTGGRIEFGPKRHAYQFYFFTGMRLQDEWVTSAISLLWGCGLEHADTVLARQFDRFEEPPDWWYKTSWFWLHPQWQKDGSFQTMSRGADILMDECGVNGFGMFMHDVPWSGIDCDVGSPQPSPGMGGDGALRKAVERIRSKGGHTYAWISRHGHRSNTLGWRDSWAIKGVDGRPIRLYQRPGQGVMLDIVNCADPTFLDYMKGWIEYYVKTLGITGLFWDSGMQPLPPDFGDKPYLRWPGETSARALDFYEKIYRFGRSMSDDFFMWVEGISVDAPMNAFAVDNGKHGGGSGHALMRRIAHAGPKRLVWRSAWPHDLGSGFPFITPFNDVCWDPAEKSYRKAAADPMNKWIAKTVKERGIRHAVGIADGVSLLDEYVVACPGVTGDVTIPVGLCKGRTLKHVISGTLVKGRGGKGGVTFNLPESGAYCMTS